MLKFCSRLTQISFFNRRLKQKFILIMNIGSLFLYKSCTVCNHTIYFLSILNLNHFIMCVRLCCCHKIKLFQMTKWIMIRVLELDKRTRNVQKIFKKTWIKCNVVVLFILFLVMSNKLHFFAINYYYFLNQTSQ